MKVNIEIERVDKKIFDGQSKEEILTYLKENPDLLLKGFRVNDIRVLEELVKRANDPYIDTVQRQVDEVYDEAKLKQQLEHLFSYTKHYYPDFYVPKIYTIVAGFEMDVVPSDSLFLIGLDYFLGNQSYYRPPIEVVPNYIWERYHPEAIQTHVAREISGRYNLSNPSDNSVINEMIWWGKTYYFIEKVVPEAADSLVIGYSAQEIEDCETYQTDVWGHFVKQELFYATSQVEKRKYLEPRPHTFEIGQECPGRIGQWLGWQIVRAYMEKNPDITLPQLMKMTNHREIFEKSKYHPKTQE
ncbi:hypothetical protein [Bernardetia sp.]|uniref:gliding motility lipoprotein GldB n=1 Tax=Bernardetia sp. TaxID=1937974 RepID=UPI0025C152EA|nr:hypothetical protein [Bernardetia sp.]